MVKPILASLYLTIVSITTPLIVSAAPAPAFNVAAPAIVTPEEIVNILASKLSLSEEQKNAMTLIVADRQQRIKSLLADTTPHSMQRRHEFRAVMRDSDKKINAILTIDQQQKYAQIEQTMRKQMRQRMQESNSGGTN